MSWCEPMADFNMITDRVATGAALVGPADVKQILEAGLNVVVDARDDFDDGPLFAGNAGVHYLWNPTPDDKMLKPVEYWKRTLDFVMPLLAVPRMKVYLHCSAGVNRGPSNAFCVLVAQGLDPKLADSLIRQARPKVELAYEGDALAACIALGYV